MCNSALFNKHKQQFLPAPVIIKDNVYALLFCQDISIKQQRMICVHNLTIIMF